MVAEGVALSVATPCWNHWARRTCLAGFDAREDGAKRIGLQFAGSSVCSLVQPTLAPVSEKCLSSTLPKVLEGHARSRPAHDEQEEEPGDVLIYWSIRHMVSLSLRKIYSAATHSGPSPGRLLLKRFGQLASELPTDVPRRWSIVKAGHRMS